MKRKLALVASALLLSCVAGSALAQGYPDRSITMVMPYAAGGPGDSITRLFAAAMQKELDQQIIVENPSGASGTIGTAKVAKSKPDGYTLLMIHVSHATSLALFKNLPYHPVNDFEPIGQATEGPMVVVVRKDFPANNAKEFVDYVRKNGEKISLGHAGVGSASNLCGLLLMDTLGVKMNQIPYKGSAPALNDVMGGQIDVLCDQTSGTIPAIKGGRVKGIAVAGNNRLPDLLDLPALSEAGVKGFDISISFGLYAPKGTPPDVIKKLTAALNKSVQDPEVKDRLAKMGISAVSPEKATPDSLRKHLLNEVNTLGGLLTKAGVQAN